MRIIRKMMIFGLLFVVWMASSVAVSPAVISLEIKGPIGPATEDFIHRGLERAAAENAAAVILQIDTPGGLSEAMRGIVQDILQSPLPVLGYVAPGGARAASAGTFILYACHLAAMAPGTNLGAASPVQLGAPESGTKSAKSTEEQKAFHDAQAYIRSLAELRKRNAEWAELAVSKAASLTAQQALAQKVIDMIADNPADLLTQADGKMISIRGQIQTIHTRGLAVHSIAPDWRTRLLGVITNPSVAYILLIIGVYGLFFEFMNPGLFLPGVAGLIALLLALYALQMLPIDYAGLGLIIAGLGFIIAEIFLPTFGALGIGGAIAFLIGSIMLMKSGSAGFNLPLPLIIAVTGVTLLLFLGLTGLAIRARRRPVVTGREGMIGQVGEAVLDHGEIWIHVGGERWRPVDAQGLRAGQQVKVTGLKGLKLQVKPIDGEK
jgi:membrane-bound serine protease (ClpP class)